MPGLFKHKTPAPVIKSVYLAKGSDEFMTTQLVFDPVSYPPLPPTDTQLKQPAMPPRKQFVKGHGQQRQNQVRSHEPQRQSAPLSSPIHTANSANKSGQGHGQQKQNQIKSHNPQGHTPSSAICSSNSANKSGSTENLVNQTNGKKATKSASTLNLLESANGSKHGSQSNLGTTSTAKQSYPPKAVMKKHLDRESEPGPSKNSSRTTGYGTTKSETQATGNKYLNVMKVGTEHVKDQTQSREGTSRPLHRKEHLKKTSLGDEAVPEAKSKGQVQRHPYSANQLLFEAVNSALSPPPDTTLQQPSVRPKQKLNKERGQQRQNQTKSNIPQKHSTPTSSAIHSPNSANKSGTTENLVHQVREKNTTKYASTPDLLDSANGSKHGSQSKLDTASTAKQGKQPTTNRGKRYIRKSEPGSSKSSSKTSGYRKTKSEAQATGTNYPIAMPFGIQHLRGQTDAWKGTSRAWQRKDYQKTSSLDGGGLYVLKSNRRFQRRSQQILNRASQEFELKFNNPLPSNVCLNDFKIIKPLGHGAFGQVMLVMHTKTRKHHAMKIFQKTKVVEEGQKKYAINEMKILQAIDCPFIVKLKYHFKDFSNLYMVMEYVPGGEMFYHIRRQRHFSEDLSRFFAAQLLLALEYLHNLDIAFRDLKPENILIDSDGYIKLIDFGFAKQIKRNRTWSVCGTQEYMAPEIIENTSYGKAIDWWALGILIYEMMAGFPPYRAEDLKAMLEKIKSTRIRYPKHFSADAKDLIGNLLQIDATRRYGSGFRDAEEIRSHSWFAHTDWAAIYDKMVRSSLIPKLKDEGHNKHFDITKDSSTKDLFKHSDVDLYPDDFKDF